jgi:hypothetical protein
MHNLTKFRFLSFTVITVFIFTASCVNHELSQYTCTSTISFAADVNPIIVSKCAIPNCHNGSLGDDRDWRQVSRFQAHKTLVKEYTRNHIMPPAESTEGPLTEDQINTLSCWVDQGAQNN